jgi:hypothetical protein
VIQRIYHHYLKWEDWQNGMYRSTIQADDAEAEELIQYAFSLLSSPKSLYASMSSVVLDWPIASEVNLSHKSINRQAWLGQAACCYEHQVPEHLTKQAWHRLTLLQQDKANAIADRIIREWEEAHAHA